MRDRRLVFALQFGSGRNADVSLCEQLARNIARLIRTGELAANERLPSTRALAKQLGISRNTALRAYDELRAAGLIEGHVRSAMRVCRPLVEVSMAVERTSHALVNEGRVPVRIVQLGDPDGNGIYLRY